MGRYKKSNLKKEKIKWYELFIFEIYLKIKQIFISFIYINKTHTTNLFFFFFMKIIFIITLFHLNKLYVCTKV